MTAGLAQSRSQPLSMAVMVYEPGTTPFRLKLPSRSLWSLRKGSRFDSGSLGTKTTIAPATLLPPCLANPSTIPMPSTDQSETVRDEAAGTFSACAEVRPLRDALRTTDYSLL